MKHAFTPTVNGLESRELLTGFAHLNPASGVLSITYDGGPQSSKNTADFKPAGPGLIGAYLCDGQEVTYEVFPENAVTQIDFHGSSKVFCDAFNWTSKKLTATAEASMNQFASWADGDTEIEATGTTVVMNLGSGHVKARLKGMSVVYGHLSDDVVTDGYCIDLRK